MIVQLLNSWCFCLPALKSEEEERGERTLLKVFQFHFLIFSGRQTDVPVRLGCFLALGAQYSAGSSEMEVNFPKILFLLNDSMCVCVNM